MARAFYEVVIDHNDPAHHDRMGHFAQELMAWAKEINCRTMTREETQIRPGVMRLRFLPDRKARRTGLGADRLQLSRR